MVVLAGGYSMLCCLQDMLQQFAEILPFLRPSHRDKSLSCVDILCYSAHVSDLLMFSAYNQQSQKSLTCQ